MSDSEDYVHRRSRILVIQKKTLVQLVRNYFIRHTGGHNNVNFDVICKATWEKFANILNTLGPAKTAGQWKNSFSGMCSRIRNKVALIHQSGANPVDKLFNIDLQIFEMLPMVDYETLNSLFEDDSEVPLEIDKSKLDISETAESEVFRYQHFQDAETTESYQLFDYLSDLEYDNELDLSIATCKVHNSAAEQTEMSNDISGHKQNDNDINLSVDNSKVGSSRTVVVMNEQELEMYLDDDVLIVEDEHLENLTNDEIDRVDATNFGEIQNLRANIIGQTITSRPKLPKNMALPSTVKPVNNAKTNARIPDVQKERLVQLVHNNFLKAVGRFAGANGANIKKRLWQNITTELNGLGPARTADQWKSTFDGIKASAKAKLADSHNVDNGTAGKQLNRLEEKIIAIYGMDSLDGDQRLGEAGFNYRKTVPAARHVNNRRNDSIASVEGSSGSLSRSERLQVSSTSTSGAYEMLARNALSQETRNASSDDDIVLQDILREIWGETDNCEVETENVVVSAPSTRATNTTRNIPATSNMNLKTTRNASGGSSAGRQVSTITRRDHDDVRGRSSRRSIHHRSDDEDGGLERLCSQHRDRSNLRNRYTSYDMVQRSIQQQELFIENHGRNHAEMMYASDSNHAQMISMFTSTLQTLADVARDFLRK